MAATDVISLAAAKSVLDIAPSDTRYDVLLASVVEAVSELLDQLCGPIVQRTVAGEVHDAPHGCRLMLKQWPVVSITAVRVWDSGAATTLTAESLATAGGYLAEPTRGVEPDRTSARLSRVIRRRGSWTDEAWDSGTRIEVDYIAGRYANTAAVAERFRLAAMESVKFSGGLWLPNMTTTPEGFVLPATSVPPAEIPDTALGRLARDRQNVVGIA